MPFIFQPRHITRDKKLNIVEKSVYYIILDSLLYSNEQSISMVELGELFFLSLARISQIIKKFKELNLIEIYKDKKRTIVKIKINEKLEKEFKENNIIISTIPSLSE